MIRIYEKSAKAKAENSWFPPKMAEKGGLKASPRVRPEERAGYRVLLGNAGICRVASYEKRSRSILIGYGNLL